MKIQQIGEFGLIEALQKSLQTRGGVRLGIGDDAAWLETLKAPVVTCDALVEGVHFRRDWTTPENLGRKAMAVNVSDIAAMGAFPVAAFVALALPENESLSFVEQLYSGFENLAKEFNFSICGGDTTRTSGPLFLSITMIGEPADELPVLRSSASAGDILIVTGSLGDAAAGLYLLQNPEVKIAGETREKLLQRHHNPTPRLREMLAALEIQTSGGSRAVTAALDISDGLCGDAAHIARASNVSLEIETARLPLGSALRLAARELNVDALKWQLCGGEDYELLLAVAPTTAEKVCAAISEKTRTKATIIGRCIEPNENPVTLISPNKKREPAPGGFAHF